MSTRSRIGIINPDGTIRSVYCHSDGYPSYNGRILLAHYKTARKINKLIDLGDLSSLDKLVAPPKGKTHSFDKSCPGVTRAYMRDRGETDCPAETSKTLQDFDGIDTGAQYTYLFSPNGLQWLCRDVYGKTKFILNKDNVKD